MVPLFTCSSLMVSICDVMHFSYIKENFLIYSCYQWLQNCATGLYHLTGLVHVSEVSWDLVQDVRDVLSEGDKVKVKIVNIDRWVSFSSVFQCYLFCTDPQSRISVTQRTQIMKKKEDKHTTNEGINCCLVTVPWIPEGFENINIIYLGHQKKKGWTKKKIPLRGVLFVKQKKKKEGLVWMWIIWFNLKNRLTRTIWTPENSNVWSQQALHPSH